MLRVNALDDAVLLAPRDCVGIPASGLNVRKGCCAGHLRAAVGAIEDRDQHGAVEQIVRRKAPGGDTVHQVVFIDIAHGVGVPGLGSDVCKRKLPVVLLLRKAADRQHGQKHTKGQQAGERAILQLFHCGFSFSHFIMVVLSGNG